MPKLILPFFLLFLAALSTAACELVRPGAALSQDTTPAERNQPAANKLLYPDGYRMEVLALPSKS